MELAMTAPEMIEAWSKYLAYLAEQHMPEEPESSFAYGWTRGYAEAMKRYSPSTDAPRKAWS